MTATATTHARTALVTGASRGIGRAIAVALAKRGYRVTCVGRDREALEATVQEVTAHGGIAEPVIADVTDAAAMDRAIEVAAPDGRLGVLVNNAGIFQQAPSAELSVDDFRFVIETNMVASFSIAARAFPSLAAAGNSCIVNIGSIFGSIGVPGAAAYCAAKAGLEGLTRALAAEWARSGVRVVCLAPGYVASDISKEVLENEKASDAITRRIPQRRFADAAEVAEAVAFVATAASFMTGSTLVMDGGQITSI